MVDVLLSRVFLTLILVALTMQLDAAPHRMALTESTVKVEALSGMDKVFGRTDGAHRASLDSITKTMTVPKALQLIKRNSLTNSSTYNEIVNLLTHGKKLRGKGPRGDERLGGIDGARLLLNDMIYEVMLKYDKEIARCTSYYTAQCALMEAARGQISAANYIAATSRALILDAQGNINHLEILIPETQAELSDHNGKCKTELKKMNAKLKVMLGDIAVMTMILEMSDCEAGLLQKQKMQVLRCEDECTKKQCVTFNHKSFRDQVKMLKSPVAKDWLTGGFMDMFDEDEEDGLNHTVHLVQVNGSEEPVITRKEVERQVAATKAKLKGNENKTKAKYNLPPMRAYRSACKSSKNPCEDPDAGAPSETTKRGAKCTMTKKPPRCYELQERFLRIQAEITDARDALMDEISKTETTCADTKNTLEASLNSDGALLGSTQTKLAAAMEKEASAGETGRQVARENQQYNDDLVSQMKTCSKHYVEIETELCALRKLRGELHIYMKKKHFFQDCEVSPWSPESCTKRCTKRGTNPGNQKLSRTVLTHASGGCKCLPLAAERLCNLQPCPIDCVVAPWGGWSKCSSKCGGGMKNRVRDVKTPMQYGGKQCGSLSESAQCNVDGCELDCVLSSWTEWSGCTKDCDGGSRKRQKFVKVPAQGSGKCANMWDKTRLQYKPCAAHRCVVPNPNISMKCNTSMDLVMVVDGSPKHDDWGFARMIVGVHQFIGAFQGPGVTAKPNFALIHYSGPRTWNGVSKCTGKSTKKVNMATVCKVKLVQHFTPDFERIKGKVDGLEFVKGVKLLSLALMSVQSELALGNKNHRTMVVVWIDGQPLSYRKTTLASRAIRKKARLLYVAVAKFTPLSCLKNWVSRRWQENLVVAKWTTHLPQGWLATRIIANICPKETPKLKFPRAKKAR